MKTDSKIYIAGHNGMVGSAIIRKLNAEGYTYKVVRNSSELDLRDPQAVRQFFEQEKPDYVFLAAAQVGGIQANNQYRADFLYNNLMIQNNVIHQSYVHGVQKLLFLGSSCIYPKNAPQPMKEEYLLTGELEQTNEPYAIAKIAGIKMVENYARQYGCNFTAVMPTNLYGPNDNYDLQNSHVLPALIRKFHEAKIQDLPKVEIWGTGKPFREFMHVDDLADACVFVMQNHHHWQFLNVGSGQEISIGDLAHLIQEVVGYSGKLIYNTEKPDGTPRKLMDSKKINTLGWESKINLTSGIQSVYNDYKNDRR
jgi:GDP-L-fucose synthase